MSEAKSNRSSVREDMMKITFPFSGVAGIFFPVGEPESGGTCEFATEQCLAECAAFKNSGLGKVGFERKLQAYEFITEKQPLLVCDRLLTELSEMNTKILYWYASGDCEAKHVKRILKIMRHLSLENVIQCGFTRNLDLWIGSQEVQEISEVRIALTVESYHRAEETCDISKGLIAVPDFDSGLVSLYWDKGRAGRCGPSGLIELSHESTCLECYDKHKGCFSS